LWLRSRFGWGINDYLLSVSRDSEATFLFADIAGFTALTEAHGDEQAVQLVEEFANAVQAELFHASTAST
jgi:class 3 adenylate cyclase